MAVTIGRRTFHVGVDRWRQGGFMRTRAAANRDGRAVVTAPMTGTVLEVRYDVGAQVANGDVLLVIESMKMNNELRAPVDGVVERVSVAEGDQVQQGSHLVTLAPETDEQREPS